MALAAGDTEDRVDAQEGEHQVGGVGERRVQAEVGVFFACGRLCAAGLAQLSLDGA